MSKKREQVELIDTDALDEDEDTPSPAPASPQDLVARLSQTGSRTAPLDEDTLAQRLVAHPAASRVASLERTGVATPVIPDEPNDDARARYQPVNLKIQVPQYVQDWLDEQARQARGRTKRSIVLAALRDAGCPVEEADLYDDGRRVRGSARDRFR